jgi:lipid-A-disaccharide synthase
LNSEIKPLNKRIMIVAAEASSTHYAAQLMREWSKENSSNSANHYFFGVGSNEMESLGFNRIGKSEEMAVVGIAEIIEHYGFLKNIFYKLLAESEKNRPDIVILMDYPDFNLRLAKKLKEMGIKVFYYISPQVWAWRKNRIYDIKAYCEKVFLLFPFEKAFYDLYEVPNMFVGHPLLDDLNPDLLDSDKVFFQRSKYGISSKEKVLALMPGSRHSEVEQHFQIQQDVARKLMIKYPHLRLLICVAPPLSKEYILQKLENFNLPYILLKEDPNVMISMSDYVLVASGTATLMVGLLEKPMVIMYKMKWLTGLIGKMLIRNLKFFGLVNLILDEEVAPERKQKFANVNELTGLLEKFINDEDHVHQTKQKLKKLKTSLGDKGAASRVVRALNKYL